MIHLRAKIYQILFLALMLAGKGYAGTSESGAVFLLISPDARQNGMAGVFTAIADDALATYYNDAGMAFQQKYGIGFTHMNWLPGLYPGMYYDNICAVVPIQTDKYKQAVGVNFISLNTGNTEGTDDRGNKIGEWETYDRAIKVSYALRLTGKFGAGIGVKYIYSFLCPIEVIRLLYGDSIKYGGNAKTIAFDLSGFYVPGPKLQFGFSIQNLGPDLTYIEGGVGDHLPWTLRAGAAYRVMDTKNNKLTVSGDITKVLVGFYDDLRKNGIGYVYDDTWKGLGIEYLFLELLSLRWGCFSDVTGGRSGVTLGFGVQFAGFSVDFADDSEMYYFMNDDWKISFHYCFKIK